MRKALLILTPLLLAGCVNDSASYFINGSDHALTLRAEQEWIWNDSATLYLTASNLPDCQRRVTLGEFPLDAVRADVFQSESNRYVFRMGSQAWTIDATSCDIHAIAAGTDGTRLGSFALADSAVSFVPVAGGAPVPAQ